MANPAIKDRNSTMNFDGLALECDSIQVNGKTVLTSRGAHIADLADAALDTSDTYTDAAVDAAINAVVAKVNVILARLEDLGLNEDS